MAVVIDLDARRALRQAESLGDAVQEFRLARRIGEFAAQRLPGVGQGMSDQPGLLAPLGHGDLDLALGLDAQRLGQQRPLGEIMRDVNAARHRLVVIELGDEALQNLLWPERAIGAREIGAVAPILLGAEEEHLDAGLPALAVSGEDVGLLHARAD